MVGFAETPQPHQLSRSVFERIATWAYRRRWWALLSWVLVLGAVTAAAQMVGAQYHNDFSLPGTESQRALDALDARPPLRPAP